MREYSFKRIGGIMREAMEKRKDRPNVAMMDYLRGELEIAKSLRVEPAWKKLFREARNVWLSNL